jgi:hypothetical protein
MAEKELMDTLRKLVSDFETLDSAIARHISVRDFSILDKAVSAKREIKRLLGENPPVKAPRDLAVKLKKVRDNQGYMIDIATRCLEEISGKSLSQESEDGIDFVEALFSEGTANYVDQEFFRRRNRIGALIVGQSLPDHILYHFKTLRSCFCLGLFEPAIIYCRALIETCCFEALRRRNKIHSKSNIEDIREFSLHALMDSIKPFVKIQNWLAAKTVIKHANAIVHSKRRKLMINEQQSYDAIRSTFLLIEELFR